MSSLRRLKREVVKNKCYKENHNTRAFHHEWEKVHYGVTEEVDNDGNVVSAKSNKVEKKKQRHFDDGKNYVKYLKAWKSMIDNMRTNKSNAREKVC